MTSFTSIPVTAASVPDVYGQQSSLNATQDLLSLNRLQHPTSSAGYGDAAYTTAASPVSATYAASPTPYDQLGYAPAPMRNTFALAPDAEHSRRYSQSLVTSASDISVIALLTYLTLQRPST
jgi:hypothetical protein